MVTGNFGALPPPPGTYNPLFLDVRGNTASKSMEAIQACA